MRQVDVSSQEPARGAFREMFSHMEAYRMNGTRWFVRLPQWLIVVTLGGVLSACAAVQSVGQVEHGFDVSSVGSGGLSDVLIRYGEVRRAFCDRGIPCRRGYSIFYGVHMPIQEEMRVSWKTADGALHHIRVPVKG